MNQGKTASIFIVEDETIVAEDIREILQKSGYHVPGMARSAQQALEQIQRTQPELVLMDIHLDGAIDGIEVAEQIFHRHKIPVIFLTAYADDIILDRAKRTQPFGYIIKPVDEAMLFAAIEIALYKADMEKQLRESESKYRALFENIPDGFCFCHARPPAAGRHPDYEILDVNTAFLQLTGLSGIAGKGFFETVLLDGGVYGELYSLCQRVAETGSPETLEFRSEVLNVWLRALVSRPREEHIVMIFENINDSRLAAEALLLTNKKLNLLSSITRHDISNQIHALYGYLGLLKLKLGEGPWTEYVLRGAQIADTIERQITFTKEYQDLGVQVPTWQSVESCVARSVAALPHNSIHIEILPPSPEIYADPLLEKVFYNLIDNAFRYGGESFSRIQVRSEKSGTGLTIIVGDDGDGIAAEDKQHLFTKGFGKNTGFGLFLSREILSITGIGIRETGIPGKGAAFEILVPHGGYRFPDET